MSEPWPDLTLSGWQDTRDTLHLWTQVVGAPTGSRNWLAGWDRAALEARPYDLRGP